jgi:hypothetical protein
VWKSSALFSFAHKFRNSAVTVVHLGSVAPTVGVGTATVSAVLTAGNEKKNKPQMWYGLLTIQTDSIFMTFLWFTIHHMYWHQRMGWLKTV